MSDNLTFMDCWNCVAPLLPVTTDLWQEMYVMLFLALKEAEEKRIAEKQKKRKEQEHENHT